MSVLRALFAMIICCLCSATAFANEDEAVFIQRVITVIVDGRETYKTIGHEFVSPTGAPLYKGESGININRTQGRGMNSLFSDEEGKPVSGKVTNTYRRILEIDGVSQDRGLVKEEFLLKDGKTHGIQKTYRNDTLVYEGEHYSGRALWFKSYYDNGQLSRVGAFNESGPNGLFTIYNEDGSIKADSLFRNGRNIIAYSAEDDGSLDFIYGRESLYILGVNAFYNESLRQYIDRNKEPVTGVIRTSWQANYIRMEVEDGLWEGKVKKYENNRLVSESSYKRGHLHGEEIYYYANGWPKLIFNYVDGRLDGLFTERGENGAIIREVIFRQAKAVHAYTFVKDTEGGQKIVHLTDKELEALAVGVYRKGEE